MSLLFLNLAILIFVNFTVSIRISKQPAPSPPPSIVHFKLDYCYALYYSLPNSHLNRLQVVQNSVARAVVKPFKSFQISPILNSNLYTGSK